MSSGLAEMLDEYSIDIRIEADVHAAAQEVLQLALVACGADVVPAVEHVCGLASGARGDPNTHYYGGYYAIGADEAMVAELVPPACEYWNLQLCNHWLESLDFRKHTVSVNHASAVKGSDGSVRVVIADRDPGVPNWLDSAGHRRGCIILRQVGTPKPYDPRCRVVKLRDLARA